MTETPSYDKITVERSDTGVGHIVLDGALRNNRLSFERVNELEDAINRFNEDEEVRAGLITGAGGNFSSGAALEDYASEPVKDEVAMARVSRSREAFRDIWRSDIPFVAGIEGVCLGGGLELAAWCDLRVSSTDAEFGAIETKLGLFPTAGGTQRLPDLIGESRAREMILTGDIYTAEEMYDFDYVNRLADDDLHEEAFDLAEQLAAGPPVAHRYAKKALRRQRDSLEAGLSVEVQGALQTIKSDDFLRGVTNYRKDDDPDFRGR